MLPRNYCKFSNTEGGGVFVLECSALPCLAWLLTAMTTTRSPAALQVNDLQQYLLTTAQHAGLSFCLFVSSLFFVWICIQLEMFCYRGPSFKREPVTGGEEPYRRQIITHSNSMNFNVAFSLLLVTWGGLRHTVTFYWEVVTNFSMPNSKMNVLNISGNIRQISSIFHRTFFPFFSFTS